MRVMKPSENGNHAPCREREVDVLPVSAAALELLFKEQQRCASWSSVKCLI